MRMLPDMQDGPLKRIAAGLKDPIVMKLTGILVSGDWAIVEMFADGAVAKAGWTFDNNYCWLCCFQQVRIVSSGCVFCFSSIR